MPFVSAAQRKAVFAKLKAKGVKFNPRSKVERVGRHYRVRQLNPRLFSRLKMIDVGKKGGLKMVVGRLKGQKSTTTQSILLENGD